MYPHLLRNPKLHNLVYNIPPQHSILSQVNPVHILRPLSFQGPVHSYYPINAYVFLLVSSLLDTDQILYTLLMSPVSATCPVHPRVFHLTP